ncbi:MAG: hypothetical protein FWH05_07755 [Oscillospiraceae bacterium]|nr:hypothetical protein [Oscillospiraceae bacterium]
MYKNFIYDCLNAEATIRDLNDYIEYWHNNETTNTLQEFLGLTDYEYEQWGKSSDSIFRDILSCRQNGNDFESYEILSENERIAARSYNQEKIDMIKRENE